MSENPDSSTSASSANKRITKNTMMLYVRMIFLTLINIYTVRVTLECLGDLDYGIYEVVASFIGAMSFLISTMTSASQRFLSFHLGRNDYVSYSRTYSMLMLCFLIMAGAVIAIGWPFGGIVIYDFLNIPVSRSEAALWVYRFTVITFAFNILSIPFTAQIVANERMGVFAYFSVADGVVKLLIVIALLYASYDRLVLYAGLIAAEVGLLNLIYMLYCRRKFRFCHIDMKLDKILLKELGSYTGWNLFGSISGMLIVQGQSVLLNLFFGPLVNTAKGIANRIYNVVISFATNIFMAASPQIVKSYASGDNDRMIWLGIQSSRFSFFMLVVLSFPLVVVMEPVLDFWLGSSRVTPLMVAFSRLTLVYSLILALEPPITQMIRATGNIRGYQLKVGIWTLMYIPICLVVLLLGGGAITTMVVLIVLYSLVMVVRVRIAHKIIKLDYRIYLVGVIWPVIKVSGLLTCMYYVSAALPAPSRLVGQFVWLTGAFLIAVGVVWIVGLNTDDRRWVTSRMSRWVTRLRH